MFQGDITEAAEPYLKDASNLDKVRQNAYDACNRLGKYKMPFAWTAVWLHNIIKERREMGDSGGSDAESTGRSWVRIRLRANVNFFLKFQPQTVWIEKRLHRVLNNFGKICPRITFRPLLV